MTEKTSLLAGFDEAWTHEWESFKRISKDMTEEEASFQHSAYASDEREEGFPLPGTILWQLAHLEYWQRYYLDTLNAMEGGRKLPDPIPVASLADILSRLELTRTQLRDAIAKLDDADFDKPLGTITVGAFVRMMMRHDTWHSSQISVARRLYRARDTQLVSERE